jgi:hypothetical protein
VLYAQPSLGYFWKYSGYLNTQVPQTLIEPDPDNTSLSASILPRRWAREFTQAYFWVDGREVADYFVQPPED